MRLGIDLRCLAEGEQGGIAVYAKALVPRLAAIFAGSTFGFASGMHTETPSVPFPVQHIRWPNKLLNARFVVWRKPWIDALLHADICFAPTPKYFGFSPHVPLVVTIHDLSFVDHPEYFTHRQRFWHRWLRIQQLLHRATRIIAVSEHTAQDIRRYAPAVAERIRVVHSGVDHCPASTPTPYPGLPERYVLAFAPPEPRKNIANLVRAQQLAYPKTRTPLVLVGSGAVQGNGIIPLPHLGADARWQVLHHAFAFVYPSLYEGFGFPPLEAMRFGVPVVASHVTSLPEVLGDAALYVDPWDPQDIARGMQTVVDDAHTRALLRQRGTQRAAGYQWDVCARETASILQEAYAHRH